MGWRREPTRHVWRRKVWGRSSQSHRHGNITALHFILRKAFVNVLFNVRYWSARVQRLVIKNTVWMGESVDIVNILCHCTHSDGGKDRT